MSADNFITIRKHPDGGYTPVMGFASYDPDEFEDYPAVDPRQNKAYPTIAMAILVAEQEDIVEYGISVHPECDRLTTERLRLDGVMRMLMDSGDMTPMAQRMILSIFGVEEEDG